MTIVNLCISFSVISYAQQTYTDTIYIDTFQREFIVFKPQAYFSDSNRLFPMIINLHGYTSDALQQLLYTNMNAYADTAEFIVIYPYGTKDTTGNRYWNAGFSPIGADDVFFLDSLISYMTTFDRVDPNGIFICGLSNGGIMSYYMACFSKSEIRAIGSVAGTPLVSWFPCQAKRIPIIHFHGTADNTVPYNGGYIPRLKDSFLSVNRLIEFWQGHNFCVETPDSTLIDIDLTDGTQVIHYRWKHKTKDYYPVELFKIIDGGHTWPGASFIYDVTTQDIDASSELIRFFKHIYLNDIYVTHAPMQKYLKYDFLIKLSYNTFRTLYPVNVYTPDGKLVLTAGKDQIISIPWKGIFFIVNAIEPSEIYPVIIQ